MPSDAKKKREQKKKEAAKAKQSGKKVENKEDKEQAKDKGTTNNTKNSRETTPLQNGSANGIEKLSSEEILCRKLEEDMRIASEARSCTGVLGIHPRARDIKIDNFSITFHGSEMLQDTKLELNCGRRFFWGK